MSGVRGVFSTRVPMALLFGVCLAAGAAQAADEPATQASWQSYEVDFPYMGFGSYYSCTGLEDRLEEYLRQLGARKDVKVMATGCAASDVSNSIWTHVRVSLPAPADASAQDTFPAAQKTVKLSTQPYGEAGSGNCDLLEQMRDRLLPKLKLKAVDDNLHCVPRQASVGARQLQVAALVPVNDKDAEKK